MRYEQIREVPESEDPSLTIETPNLVAKVIDNTGLTLAKSPSSQSSWADLYGMHRPLPFSRPLGYHGIRTLYDKRERRNVVAPMTVWLNLQSFILAGIENDPGGRALLGRRAARMANPAGEDRQRRRAACARSAAANAMQVHH
jgi:hypothetical protein